MGRADNLAVGFDLRFQIAMEKNLYIPITIGYTSITAKDKISPIFQVKPMKWTVRNILL